MNYLKQLLRIIASILVGFPIVTYFNITNGLLRIVFYFGVYIVVSLIIEMIWNAVKEKRNEKQIQ